LGRLPHSPAMADARHGAEVLWSGGDAAAARGRCGRVGQRQARRDEKTARNRAPDADQVTSTNLPDRPRFSLSLSSSPSPRELSTARSEYKQTLPQAPATRAAAASAASAASAAVSASSAAGAAVVARCPRPRRRHSSPSTRHAGRRLRPHPRLLAPPRHIPPSTS
jgi:hypothetical protein